MAERLRSVLCSVCKTEKQTSVIGPHFKPYATHMRHHYCARQSGLTAGGLCFVRALAQLLLSWRAKHMPTRVKPRQISVDVGPTGCINECGGAFAQQPMSFRQSVNHPECPLQHRCS